MLLLFQAISNRVKDDKVKVKILKITKKKKNQQQHFKYLLVYSLLIVLYANVAGFECVKLSVINRFMADNDTV